MAYQKQYFKNGNVLTAEQLNHMEDGIVKAEQTGGTTGGSSLPTTADPYMQLVTDGDGAWVADERLGYQSVEKEPLWEGDFTTVESQSTAGTYNTASAIEANGYNLLGYDSDNPNQNLYCEFNGVEIQLPYADWSGMTSLWGNCYLVFPAIYEDDGSNVCVEQYTTDSISMFRFSTREPGSYHIKLYNKAETFKTIDPEYLPEGIGYKATEETQLYDFTFSDKTVYNEESGLYRYNTEYAEAEYVYGNVIVFDGTKYITDGFIESSGATNGYIGNPALYPFDTGEDNGMPFCLDIYTTDGTTYWRSLFTNVDGDSHSVQVLNETEIIHPIPAEYLPEPIVFTQADATTVTCNKTVDEVVAAFVANPQMEAWLAMPSDGIYMRAVKNNGGTHAAYFTFLNVVGSSGIFQAWEVAVADGGFTLSYNNML